MKVLLVGEYSGVHSNLKSIVGNKADVTTISDGDGYKSYKRDINLSSEYPWYYRSYMVHVLEFLGLKGLRSFYLDRDIIRELKGHDVVQLINTAPISRYGSLANFLLIRYLKENNKKIFLSAVGDDFTWVSYSLNGSFKYSAMDRLSFRTLKSYLYSLKYIYGFGYRILDRYVLNSVKAIIPGLVDYDIPYRGNTKKTTLIPLPIKWESYDKAIQLYNEHVSDVMVEKENLIIFHGWQKGKENRKGNDVFDDVINSLKDDIDFDYRVVSNVSYDDYLTSFTDSTLFFDQLFSYDMGMNALIGLANGKIVFSGFEAHSCLDEYPSIHTIGINATPDSKQLRKNIELVLRDFNLRKSIIRNGLEYIIKHHNPAVISDAYLEVWSKNGQ
ncbi:glycosyltransferase [Vibrio comitans]|uniref:Glycosyl transferase family 1 n=1 Tax=Vibrio comitans NBRC 102076 TaxID=1219078 RepID=A0A4Y3ITD5_9VIBR|nr:hypothetical protein [Vibrio comitans]GEA62000.1 glycosyl transferase family 1 [Vibrio comitans NBRC 102076]